jgi:hypothetical protein
LKADALGLERLDRSLVLAAHRLPGCSWRCVAARTRGKISEG